MWGLFLVKFLSKCQSFPHQTSVDFIVLKIDAKSVKQLEELANVWNDELRCANLGLFDFSCAGRCQRSDSSTTADVFIHRIACLVPWRHELLRTRRIQLLHATQDCVTTVAIRRRRHHGFGHGNACHALIRHQKFHATPWSHSVFYFCVICWITLSYPMLGWIVVIRISDSYFHYVTSWSDIAPDTRSWHLFSFLKKK